MSNLKKFILSSLVFCGFAVFAQRAPIEKVDTTSELSNLIRESESLKVLTEDSVQNHIHESERVYSLLIGRAGPANLAVSGLSDTYAYQLGEKTSPVIGASLSLLPWRRALSGGVDLGISYMTQNGEGLSSAENAQLHILFVEPSVFVKRDVWGVLAPRLGVGYGMAALFQRGFDDENTSTTKGYGLGYGALDIYMSRLAWFRSELDWSLSLEHRMAFGSASSSVAVHEIQRTFLRMSLRL